MSVNLLHVDKMYDCNQPTNNIVSMLSPPTIQDTASVVQWRTSAYVLIKWKIRGNEWA